MSSKNRAQELQARYGNNVTSTQVNEYIAEVGIRYSTIAKQLKKYKVPNTKGQWNLASLASQRQALEDTFVASPSTTPQTCATLKTEQGVVQNLVPMKDAEFVPFGNFNDVKKVLRSKQFYPMFITGLSGNGKTYSVEQACAQLNRELIRVNITIETDEDDLIGGFRLVDGDTVWHNGPVIEALEKGAVLLLDEVDLASNKVLCLQSILEGKGVFLKKIGRYVRPSAGFTVIATANTKGKGSDDGRFVGTNVLNEAFLERFALTFEQEYPTVATETKILEKASASLAVLDKEFCSHLANWADIIRRTFNDGGVDEVISTRRLVHIVRAFAIWNDRMKAIKVCTNRFDDETKQSFLELYDKIDADVVPNEVKDEQTV